VVLFFEKGVAKLFSVIYRNQKKSVVIALVVMVISFASAKFLGTEFLPELNEGALWVEAELPMSVSLTEANVISNKMIDILKSNYIFFIGSLHQKIILYSIIQEG
jgi:cobalt-zinc-cadmium resistance protein CzcA